MSSWIKTYRKKPKVTPHTNTDNTFVPTFHIFIATSGRPSLENMLNSLKNELLENDAITIIFDGPNALKTSTFQDTWIKNHKSKINILEQDPTLGYWGHGIRNAYQGNLEPTTTFIMNADDDDTYVPGSFDKLRKICSDPDILYIAKFLFINKNIIVPSQNSKIIRDDIGTPCGIIPFRVANKAYWELKYGGDFDYYNNIQQFVKEVKFLDIIIYHVL